MLARNSEQHNGSLTMDAVEHDPKTRKKFPRPFFALRDGPDVREDGRDNFLADWIHDPDPRSTSSTGQDFSLTGPVAVDACDKLVE